MTSQLPNLQQSMRTMQPGLLSNPCLASPTQGLGGHPPLAVDAVAQLSGIKIDGWQVCLACLLALARKGYLPARHASVMVSVHLRAK